MSDMKQTTASVHSGNSVGGYVDPHVPTSEQSIRAQCLTTALHSGQPGVGADYKDVIKRAQAFYDFIMGIPPGPATVTDIKAVE